QRVWLGERTPGTLARRKARRLSGRRLGGGDALDERARFLGRGLRVDRIVERRVLVNLVQPGEVGLDLHRVVCAEVLALLGLYAEFARLLGREGA
ncbi:MAG: hypothetical protein JKY65_33095, partial [Planctomycetes bacterium]|nr:hypothetical protein [Planctomycetota bacterium]